MTIAPALLRNLWNPRAARCRPALAMLALMLAMSPSAEAQTEPSKRLTVVELILSDGSRLYGRVASETDDEVTFETTAGVRVTVTCEQIRTRRPVAGWMVNGEFQRDDPNDTRLLFGPTGRSLARGEGYVGVYAFLLPFVQVGVTDRISVGGGTPLVIGLNEASRPFWVTPKVQVWSSRETHASVGLFHGFSPRDSGAGVAYGVLTRDVASGSLTAGAGMAYSSDGRRGPVVMVGADGPVRRNMKIVTENYAWRSAGVVSLGVRFFGENLSADLALGIAFGADGVFGMPVVNFVRRF